MNRKPNNGGRDFNRGARPSREGAGGNFNNRNDRNQGGNFGKSRRPSGGPGGPGRGPGGNSFTDKVREAGFQESIEKREERDRKFGNRGGDRPNYGRPNSDRPYNNDRGGDRGGYRGGDNRGGDRPGYGNREGDRGGYRGGENRGGYGGNRDDRGGYNRGGDRPYGDRPQGDRGGFNRGGDRPYNRDNRGGDRPGYGNRDGDRGGYRGGDNRGGYGGNRDDRGGYNRGGDRPYGDRPQGDRGGFNRGGDRPYNRDNRGGDRPYGGDRGGDNRGGFNRDNRGGDRPYGGGRGGDRPYGDRPQRSDRPYGDRGGFNRGGDRPQGDRPGYRNRDNRGGYQGDRPRREGGFNREGGYNREGGNRFEGNRGERSHGPNRAERYSREREDRAPEPVRAPIADTEATEAYEDSDRLHVRIAKSGLCSRRAAEQLITEGRVQVNGDVVEQLGTKVTAEDEIKVDGQILGIAKKYTLLLNKPTGVVTTLSDPQGRPTIATFLPDYGVQLKPVGRLDKDTDGLILITNDGDLSLRLMHPRYGVEKTYRAVVEGIPDEKRLDRLRKGVFIETGKTSPAQVTVIHTEEKSNRTTLEIAIHEGKKRQVRLMCEAIGHPVDKLTRIKIGPFSLKGMRPGECLLLGKQEVDNLRRMVGLDAE